MYKQNFPYFRDINFRINVFLNKHIFIFFFLSLKADVHESDPSTLWPLSPDQTQSRAGQWLNPLTAYNHFMSHCTLNTALALHGIAFKQLSLAAWYMIVCLATAQDYKIQDGHKINLSLKQFPQMRFCSYSFYLQTPSQALIIYFGCCNNMTAFITLRTLILIVPLFKFMDTLI